MSKIYSIVLGLCMMSTLSMSLRVCVDSTSETLTLPCIDIGTKKSETDVLIAFPPPVFTMFNFRSALPMVTNMREKNYTYFVISPTHKSPGYDAGIIVGSKQPIMGGSFIPDSNSIIWRLQKGHIARVVFENGIVTWILRKDVGLDMLEFVNGEREKTDIILMGSHEYGFDAAPVQCSASQNTPFCYTP